MKKLFALMLCLTLVLGCFAGLAEEEAEIALWTAEMAAAEETETAPEATATETTDTATETTDPATETEPAEEAPAYTFAAVDNSTALADGEYEVDATFTGGTGKVTFTLEKITVKDGKATATLSTNSANQTHLFTGTTASTAEIAELYNAETDAMGEGVYAFADKAVTIPVAIGAETAFAARTTAMSNPHWVNYTYTLKVKVKPLSDGDYTIEVESDNKMFKVVAATLTAKNGAYTAAITLSGTGYDKLFAGTAEAATAAQEAAAETLIGYTEDAEGKYVFNVPVSALSEPLPFAAHSVKNDNWLDRNLTFKYETAKKIVPPTPTVALTKASAKAKLNVGVATQIDLNGAEAKSYKSSKAAVAKVSKTGLITPKKAGTAKITVTLKNGKKRVLTLTVVDPTKATKVTISNGKKATLKVGETLDLAAVVSPETAVASTKLTWKSSKAAVAKVSKTGVVTAKKAGTAKITVKTDSGKTATITITVKK